jgi:hypothetical protein
MLYMTWLLSNENGEYEDDAYDHVLMGRLYGYRICCICGWLAWL